MSSETIPVNAQALSEAYTTNIDRADQTYKGRTLLLTGSVSSILKERPGWITVYFSTGRLSSEVQCIFANEQSKSVGQLKEGQEVKVKGYCEGKKDYIQLSNCIVVPD
ncbi:MAG TPA: hypothetical protein VJS44_01920 [Pyrinomonadaceae bacterium]|nr:hypothetical protein [Pyrinomonadaceae bacterium]